MISGKKCRASMRLSTEVTRSNTVVNCSILSTDQSFFDLGLAAVLNAGSLLAFSKNSSTGRSMNLTKAKPTAKDRMPMAMISQKTQVAGSAPWVEPVLRQPEGQDGGKRAEPGEDKRDDDVEADVVTGVFHLLAINDRSHMGRKMARAKKPTTAARQMVRTGAIASDSFFVAYSTSVS